MTPSEQSNSVLAGLFDSAEAIELRVGRGSVFLYMLGADGERVGYCTLDARGAHKLAGRLQKAANDLRSSESRRS